MPCVVDASVVVDLLLGGERGRAVKLAVDGREMVAPDLVNMETLSALRRLMAAGAMPEDRTSQAVADLQSLPLDRVSTTHLIADAWALRKNLTPYNASYISLARALGCELLTADRRLAGAPNLGARVVIVQ